MKKNSSFSKILWLVVTAALCMSCGDSDEIGSSGITEQDIQDAVELSEEQRPVQDRPSASAEDVTIRANLCETTDPDSLDDGLRRRVWISVENRQAEIVSVTAAITFTDGTVLQSDPHDVGALFEGDPGSNSFGTYDTVEQDPARLDDDCFDEIESIEIVEIGEPVWMRPEDDRGGQ